MPQIPIQSPSCGPLTTSDLTLPNKSRIPRVRFGVLPTRPKVKEALLDNFGNMFHLRTTQYSSIAIRRERRRLTLDLDKARDQHAQRWQYYVLEHDGRFEELADQIRYKRRAQECAAFRRSFPEAVLFCFADYKADSQPRTKLVKSTDGQPVSPGTRPAREQMSAAEVHRAVRDHGGGYACFVAPADIGPFDLEAQTGLAAPEEDDMVSGLWSTFSDAMSCIDMLRL